MGLLSVCSEIPFRGRGTFGLENSSGAEDKEQLIFSLSHQLVGQGAATNKDRLTGDSDILIRLWMFFRPYVLHVMKRATGRRGKWLIEQLTQTTVDIRGFSRMRHLSCSATLDLSLEPNNTDSLFKKKEKGNNNKPKTKNPNQTQEVWKSMSYKNEKRIVNLLLLSDNNKNELNCFLAFLAFVKLQPMLAVNKLWESYKKFLVIKNPRKSIM